MTDTLQSPFPYFGGKSRVGPLVWQRFGSVANYVEPFLGSASMLLLRPQPFDGTETVNDACGFVANFWRAVKADPEAVAEHADNPVNENDLHARHIWLVNQRESMQARLEGDPEWCDPKVAGWWCWGMACWIAGGFCSGEGPWHRAQNEAGEWVLTKDGDAGQGVTRKLVHLGAGQGVNRQLVHLGDAGRGVNRQLVHLGNAGQGGLYGWMQALADRFARVRVCCGDWARVCGPTPTIKLGATAVFLDPPYAHAVEVEGKVKTRDSGCYGLTDCGTVAHEVREWCLSVGVDKLYTFIVHFHRRTPPHRSCPR